MYPAMPEETTNPILANYLSRVSVPEADTVKQRAEEEPQRETFREGRHVVSSIADSSGFFSLETQNLPMAMFYPQGTRIQIRPATTGEIQAYSVVDDKNIYDVTVKMNEMLGSCSRIVSSDGSYSSYREIKDADKLYIVTEIARATANKGRHLVQDAVCTTQSCKQVNKIELNAKHFVLTQPDDEFVRKYFNQNTGAFDFTLKSNDTRFTLGAPSIGLAMDLYAYIIDCVTRNQKVSLSFMKCVPWMMYNRTSITLDEAAAEESKFESMNKELFMAINATVDKMKFGISELKGMCSKCGVEVRTPFTFPGGASALFIVPNAFDELVG